MEIARLHVEDRSSVGAARNVTRRLADVAGYGDQLVSQALIVASELATNLVLHAGSGSFLVRAEPGRMTFVAWDRGPGIPDVSRAFEDGFSTSGTAGSGLGAIRRLTEDVQIRSLVGEGTVLVARMEEPPPQPAGFAVDGLTLPMSGEGPTGDHFASRLDGDALTVLLADGLGHGEYAAEAAERSVATLLDGPDREPGELLEVLNRELRGTRGAAIGVARLEPRHGRVRFAGTGNIAGLRLSPSTRRTFLSLHGIVGREQRHVTETSYELGPEHTVVLHTDGVREGFDPERRRGALREDPLVLATCIVAALERGRDDVGVLVARAVPVA